MTKAGDDRLSPALLFYLYYIQIYYSTQYGKNNEKKNNYTVRSFRDEPASIGYAYKRRR